MTIRDQASGLQPHWSSRGGRTPQSSLPPRGRPLPEIPPTPSYLPPVGLPTALLLPVGAGWEAVAGGHRQPPAALRRRIRYLRPGGTSRSFRPRQATYLLLPVHE